MSNKFVNFFGTEKMHNWLSCAGRTDLAVIPESFVEIEDDPESVAEQEEADDAKQGVRLTPFDLHLGTLTI